VHWLCVGSHEVFDDYESWLGLTSIRGVPEARFLRNRSSSRDIFWWRWDARCFLRACYGSAGYCRHTRSWNAFCSILA
jgi:hypothetical protein